MPPKTRRLYYVTRQHGFYDDEPRVEIALGADEVSPGALVAHYEQEGEHDTAAAAVSAARELAAIAGAATTDDPPEPWPITISSAASIGCYPTSDDDRTDELDQWAERRAELDHDADDDDEPYDLYDDDQEAPDAW